MLSDKITDSHRGGAAGASTVSSMSTFTSATCRGCSRPMPSSRGGNRSN